MLLSVMLCAVSAEDEVEYKLDARFLQEYGQKVYFVEETATAPIIDGSVQTNEYDVAIKTTFDKDYDFIDDSHVYGTFELEWANYYLSWDDECLYIAAEVKDPDPTTFGQWPENVKRADQLALSLGGMIDAGDPLGIASYIQFRFFDGITEDKKAELGFDDYFEIQDLEKDFMGQNVSGTMLDVSTFTKDHLVVHNPDTQVTTYEVAINWDAIESVWPHQEGKLQYQLLTLGFYVQGTTTEIIPDKNVGSKTGIYYWGTVGDQVNDVYDKLMDEYTSAAYYGWTGANDKLIPNMFFRGTEEEYNAFMAARLVAKTPETEAPVVEDPETENVEDPTTDAPATDAPSADDPATDEPKTDGGCGSSVAAVGVALVAALGTCTAFINKRR